MRILRGQNGVAVWWFLGQNILQFPNSANGFHVPHVIPALFQVLICEEDQEPAYRFHGSGSIRMFCSWKFRKIQQNNCALALRFSGCAVSVYWYVLIVVDLSKIRIAGRYVNRTILLIRLASVWRFQITLHASNLLRFLWGRQQFREIQRSGSISILYIN